MIEVVNKTVADLTQTLRSLDDSMRGAFLLQSGAGNFRGFELQRALSAHKSAISAIVTHGLSQAIGRARDYLVKNGRSEPSPESIRFLQDDARRVEIDKAFHLLDARGAGIGLAMRKAEIVRKMRLNAGENQTKATLQAQAVMMPESDFHDSGRIVGAAYRVKSGVRWFLITAYNDLVIEGLANSGDRAAAFRNEDGSKYLRFEIFDQKSGYEAIKHSVAHPNSNMLVVSDV